MYVYLTPLIYYTRVRIDYSTWNLFPATRASCSSRALYVRLDLSWVLTIRRPVSPTVGCWGSRGFGWAAGTPVSERGEFCFKMDRGFY